MFVKFLIILLLYLILMKDFFSLNVLLEERVMSWGLCHFVQSMKNENKVGCALCMELKYSISALWCIQMISFRTLV